MPDPWFEVVGAGVPLTQGDMISACPLLTWDAEARSADAAIDASVLRQAVKAFRADVVVMTQACDLERYLAGRAAPRLRRLPPYREHLSHAFARFFMRVGLPTPVVPAW